MKKLALLLVFAMLVSCFAACGSSGNENAGTEAEPETEAAEENTEGEITGGWMFQDAAACEISEDAQAAFDKAVENRVGTGLRAIAVLGTQVVAGTNYCFLAEVTPVIPDAVSHYSLVYVYADLDGNAEISSIADIDMTCESYTEAADTETLDGGWTVADVDGANLGEDAQAAFEKAFEAWTGAGVTPIALLGTQVVAGTNYLIIGRSSLVTAEPVSKIVLVKIYQDLQGGAEVLDICNLDIAPAEQ